jgi:hypothetical protein
LAEHRSRAVVHGRTSARRDRRRNPTAPDTAPPVLHAKGEGVGIAPFEFPASSNASPPLYPSSALKVDRVARQRDRLARPRQDPAVIDRRPRPDRKRVTAEPYTLEIRVRPKARGRPDLPEPSVICHAIRRPETPVNRIAPLIVTVEPTITAKAAVGPKIV